jgi:hypothetical protein
MASVVLPAAGRYGGGSGAASDPYLLFTAEHLAAIGKAPEDWDKQFKLMADIDLAGRGFSPIGGTDGSFTGVFDGNHRTISHLQLHLWDGRYVGLFGYVDGEHARIIRVTLNEPRAISESGYYVAPLVGYLRAGQVTECRVHAGQVRGDNCVGGLIGRVEHGAVADSSADAAVMGLSRAGGLVGESFHGSVSRCSATGDVVGPPESSCWSVGGLVGRNDHGAIALCTAACTVWGTQYIGGLVGENMVGEIHRSWAGGAVAATHDVGGLAGVNYGGIVANCYATAQVEGVYAVGGLLGRNGPSCYCSCPILGYVEHCHAVGRVDCLGSTAGLLGENDRGQVVGCFWNVETTGRTASAGGAGLTTSQMGDQGAFVRAGWDFVDESANGTEDLWRLRVGTGYPVLAWEIPPADLDADGDVDFRDYAILSRSWRRHAGGLGSGGTDLTGDGATTGVDLALFMESWLAGRQ